MPGKYIDFSNEAPAEFKNDYSKLYNQFYYSGGSGYYTLRVGIGLSTLLTGLDSALGFAKIDPEILSDINLTNSGVVLACGFIVSVSNTVSNAKLKEVVAMEKQYPHYFNKLPSITMWGHNVSSLRGDVEPFKSVSVTSTNPELIKPLKL